MAIPRIHGQALAEVIEDEAELRNKMYRVTDCIDPSDFACEQEFNSTKDLISTLDKLMTQLAAYYNASLNSGNENVADECKLIASRIWTDLKDLLVNPNLARERHDCLIENLNDATNMINRLKYTKEHIHHQEPKIKRKRKEEITVPTKNKFECLPVEENETPEVMDEAEPEATDPAPAVAKPKIVPIFVSLMENWPAFLEHINQHVVSTAVQARLVGDAIRIQPNSEEDYRALQRYLTDAKLGFHALQLKNDRPKKVVIRGVPPTTDIMDITSILVSRGHEVLSCIPMKSRRSKQLIPLMLVTIKPLPNWESIYEIDTMLNMIVKVVPYQAPTVRQCYRCQKYNHSSQTCTMPPRCNKCAGAHTTPDCKLGPKDKRKCANCGGEHPACYRGCPENPQNKLKKKPEKPTNRGRKTTPRNGNDGRGVYVPAPVPTRSVWDIGPPNVDEGENFPHLPPTGKEQNAAGQSARSTNAGETSDVRTQRYTTESKSTAAEGGSLMDIFQAIKSLMKIINIKELAKAIRLIIPRVQRAESDMDKFYVLFESVDLFKNVFNKTS